MCKKFTSPEYFCLFSSYLCYNVLVFSTIHQEGDAFMDSEIKTLLASKYQLDLEEDILFTKDEYLKFFFDWQEKPRTLYLISGNPLTLGLPFRESTIHFPDFISLIETDNELAEVEGRHTFVQRLIQRIEYMGNDLLLYLPLKHETGKLWLTVSLQKKTTHQQRPQLIYGQVIRLSHTTPVEIIHYQKTYQDPLTRLFTRETLRQHLKNFIPNDQTYAMYMDLDGFKKINDFFGHKFGDQFLIDIAERFIAVWESDVVYYRLGGDEFFIIVYHHSEEMVKARAQKLITMIESLEIEGRTAGVSASIGVVRITEENKQYDTLLDLADRAMYKAKNTGKGHCVVTKE